MADEVNAATLLAKIKASQQSLEELGTKTSAKKEEARKAGDSESMRQCDTLLEQYSLQKMTLRREQLALSDNSPELKAAIDGFDSVNKTIKDTIAANKKMAEFLQAAVNIVTIMEKCIKLALV